MKVEAKRGGGWRRRERARGIWKKEDRIIETCGEEGVRELILHGEERKRR